MRVVIDASLPLSPATGSFRYVAELIKAMNVASGPHEIVVLTAADTEAALRSAVGPPAAVEFCPSGGAGKLRERLSSARRCVRKIRPHILHSPGYFVPTGSGARTVVSVHDVNFLARFNDWIRTGNMLRSARLAAHVAKLPLTARAVIVPSHQTRKQLARVLPPLSRRLHVVGYAPTPPISLPPSFVERPPVFLSVGVIAPQKNLDTAIRAFARALPLLPSSTEYRLVGRDDTGFWGETLAPLVKELGLERNVYFAGQVDDDELELHYRQARALLFVSRGEGYGLPAVEALARGLPVIGSSTTAIRETTGGVAVLVDPDDTVAMAGELVRLMSDEAYWTDLSFAGLSRSTRSWSEVAAEHFAVYEAVAGGVKLW